LELDGHILVLIQRRTGHSTAGANLG
jgi:hypothetical protein